MNYVMLFFEGFFKFTSLNPARNTDNEIIGFAKLVEVIAIDHYLAYLVSTEYGLLKSIGRPLNLISKL